MSVILAVAGDVYDRLWVEQPPGLEPWPTKHSGDSALHGIPIVIRDDFSAGEWRLFDPATNEVKAAHHDPDILFAGLEWCPSGPGGLLYPDAP